MEGEEMSKADNIVQGEVILSRDQQTKNGKEFYQVVVQTSDKPEKYPSPVAVEFWGDKIDLAKGLTVGSEVDIHVNIRGREWNDKYYTSIVGWKVDMIRNTEVTDEIKEAADRAQAILDDNLEPDENKNVGTDDDDDNLPF